VYRCREAQVRGVEVYRLDILIWDDANRGDAVLAGSSDTEWRWRKCQPICPSIVPPYKYYRLLLVSFSPKVADYFMANLKAKPFDWSLIIATHGAK
jgi:hypothetical protein